MAALPVEILLGIYLGIIVGIVPALISWALGFSVKYFTGISIPGFGVVVLALAIAGINGGLLALSEESVRNSTVYVVAIVVVVMITLYAHAQGDKLGGNFPRKLSFKKLRERTLSTDVVELVGGRGQVRVSIVGEVGDVEGYPPLPADLREQIRDGEWTFPADIPLGELETRVADRLRSEFDLTEVSVRLDERARATVHAAPPTGGLSKRVPAGKRAVSFTTLVPTGLARGDEVSIVAGGDRYAGTVVSVKGSEQPPAKDVAPDAATDGGEDDAEPAPAPTSQTAIGGESRVTVATSRADAQALLGRDVERLAVRSRGVRQEFELVSLLRRAGRRFRKLAVRADCALDGATLGDVSVRDTYGVAVLAVRHEGRWTLAPDGSVEVAAGDDLFAVGTREALDSFAEAVA
jgi:hypothetical protein